MKVLPEILVEKVRILEDIYKYHEDYQGSDMTPAPKYLQKYKQDEKQDGT